MTNQNTFSSRGMSPACDPSHVLDPRRDDRLTIKGAMSPDLPMGAGEDAGGARVEAPRYLQDQRIKRGLAGQAQFAIREHAGARLAEHDSAQFKSARHRAVGLREQK